MNPSNEKRDHDNDRSFRSPKAWANIKKISDAIACGLPELLTQLEPHAGTGTVRLLFAAAIHHYLTMTTEQKMKALSAYFKWTDGSMGPVPEVHPVASDDDDREGEEWKDAGASATKVADTSDKGPMLERLPDGERMTDWDFKLLISQMFCQNDDGTYGRGEKLPDGYDDSFNFGDFGKGGGK